MDEQPGSPCPDCEHEREERRNTELFHADDCHEEEIPLAVRLVQVPRSQRTVALPLQCWAHHGSQTGRGPSDL